MGWGVAWSGRRSARFRVGTSRTGKARQQHQLQQEYQQQQQGHHHHHPLKLTSVKIVPKIASQVPPHILQVIVLPNKNLPSSTLVTN